MLKNGRISKKTPRNEDLLMLSSNKIALSESTSKKSISKKKLKTEKKDKMPPVIQKLNQIR
jgi:hypothetical protein